MDRKELIKKYWFVAVIAVALLAFIGVYIADAYKNREIVVNNKQIDGKYVAYSVDDEPVYADDLYETLYSNDGVSKAIIAYERAVINEAYETTSEMKDQAAVSASNVMASYSKDYIEESMQMMGYNGIDDINQYFIDALKQDMLVKEYVKENQDTYLKDTLGTDGRLIYHILVKCETTPEQDEEGNITSITANPTQEQTDKLNKILEELKDENNTFELVAYNNSEDTGSAQKGGYIGVINSENAEMYDQMFAKTALELGDGEVSEPIVSTFGYHIIKNAGSSVDALLDDYYFLSSLQSQYPDLAVRATMKKAESLGFEIKSESLKQMIESQLTSEDE